MPSAYSVDSFILVALLPTAFSFDDVLNVENAITVTFILASGRRKKVQLCALVRE